jgi:oligoribonuclease NrnB/cAMP/cGMP phosphodiesterase (DHH superfamily)
MNWTKILRDAGIPEPPGRDRAYADAAEMTAARYERDGHKRAKGSNTRKVKKMARMDYGR